MNVYVRHRVRENGRKKESYFILAEDRGMKEEIVVFDE